MDRGSVRWFNDTSGYGYIVPDDGGQDLYVCRGQIVAEGQTTLSTGQRVEFDVRVAGMGPEATGVHLPAQGVDGHS